MRVANGFTFFWHGVFSNWHPAEFTVNGIKFKNSEQYFMLLKALVFDDDNTAKEIINTPDPKAVKALGRKIKDFDEKIWEEQRFSAMYEACYQKFTQNPPMLEQLLNTIGTSLVEASPYDKIWGIGLKEDDDRVLNKDTWQGLNLLGEALDWVRNDIAALAMIEEEKAAAAKPKSLIITL